MPRDEIDMSEILDRPVLGALLQYWEDKRRGRPMPARDDIDPLEMGPKLLPHLVLCDLFDHGARVRFRLVGTTVVKRLGFDPTGQYLADQMRGGYIDLLLALHRLVYCERTPLYSESVFRWSAKRRLELRHLLLPLTNGGAEPAIALLGLACSSDEVFPPQLRALNASAVFEEGRRAVLRSPALWDEVAGRKIA